MIEEVVELRKKNQLTWPLALAEEMGIKVGMRLKIAYDPETHEARVRPILKSYAGALKGVYGATDAEVRRHVKGERESWE
jgi:bifunctional DNA-binding transcriptional regulator/antitoxin component of YhaV-PrlF toxin-antitoxin module